jgi:hypothetical protein
VFDIVLQNTHEKRIPYLQHKFERALSLSCCIWMIKEYSEHRARMVGCFVFSFWSFCVIMWFEGWRQHSFIDMLVIHF